MAQEYELTSFKVSDFKDDHGNTWCDATFKGFGEPMKWVVKDPSRAEIGKVYYGRIEEKTSKAGRPYNRFYTEAKPETEGKPTDEYWAAKQAEIKAEWSIGQAIQYTAGKDVSLDTIEDIAADLFAMVERIKAGRVVSDTEKDEDEVFDPDETETINLDEIPF